MPPLDKDWRPQNWAQIKCQIVADSPVTFSPSEGYSKDQKDTIMEKAASAILEELLNASGSEKDTPINA